jgi:hypothetical protein
VPSIPAAIHQVAERAAEIRDCLFRDTFGDRTEALHALESKLDESFRSRSYFQVSPKAREAWDASAAGMNPEQKRLWRACLLSDLIAQAPQRLPNFLTPASILPHTAAQFARILKNLDTVSARDLDDDLFLKDLALSRLDCFPCVAQIVDKNAGVGRRLVAHNLFRQPAALLAMGLSSGFRYAPTFEAHTHTPMLRGFTPAGWDQCFLLVADLLELYPHYLGLTSGSWFYDPQLDRVSPGLSFLHQRPVSGGAFFFPLGQTPAGIWNATVHSEPRRKLYEEGKYHPTGWMMVWPRQALLQWARAQRETCSGN